MPSPTEYASLSDAVYGGPGKTTAPDGWELVAESTHDAGNEGTVNGYYGAAFKNKETGEIVVANRGSRMSMEGLQQDWATSDVKIAMQDPGDIPAAFDDAEAFASQVQAGNPNAQVSFTGHSLGGGEAQIQAARLGGKAVTFAAPGVTFAVDPDQSQRAKYNVTNYVLPGDPVPLSGSHIGQTVALSPSGHTLLKDLAAVGIGVVIGGPIGALVALAGIAATHMLGNYISAISMMAKGAGDAGGGGGGGGGGGPPQARITDMHTCPMVTGVVPHVGGPISIGCFTVLVGNLPAARVSDMAVCVGPPDMIAKGSMTVYIGKMPAARMGDMTAHGGVITIGYPTVLTGG